MTPALAQLNSRDCAPLAVFSPTNLRNGNAVFKERFNFNHLPGGKDRLPVVLAYGRIAPREIWPSKTRLQAELDRMLVILSASHPGQIVKSVIRFVSVVVVCLVPQWIRIGANKCNQNQVMNPSIRASSVKVEANGVVALFHDGLKNNQARPVIFGGDRTNSTKITRFVTRKKARNWPPVFLFHAVDNTKWDDIGQIPLYKESVYA
jgi:hypothetical protein